ncbi:hypothetical protein [Nonomuraea wenchangensis]|uniref:Uncharacterized protein n=1 Tax=Nonomuraea wenchangensis TaxID=568860 RepID=A0A1I0LTM9_9ACTN|nr:hypothetical protein [Nonomuraea wenchangensis]SEU46372.1 hypothetical protein SAMN05421811_12715 [Nonomuraea wenchangensis]
MTATRTTQLSPEMALLVRYRKREGSPEPELGVRPLARKISEASGHKFNEQFWRRRESGMVTDISDKDLAWWAWGVGAPADELAATGRTVAADLLRQILTDQEDKAAAAEQAATRAADALEGFLRKAYADIDALKASDAEKARMKRFLLERTRQVLDREQATTR